MYLDAEKKVEPGVCVYLRAALLGWFHTGGIWCICTRTAFRHTTTGPMPISAAAAAATAAEGGIAGISANH